MSRTVTARRVGCLLRQPRQPAVLLAKWGFFQRWWVAVKFVITLTQLYVGLFVLSKTMPDVVAAAEAGTDGAAGGMAVAAGLMAGAIGFQALISYVKPWGRTPWAARAKTRPSAGPARPTAAALVADLLLGVALMPITHAPVPACSVLALVVVLARRARADGIAQRRAGEQPKGPA